MPIDGGIGIAACGGDAGDCDAGSALTVLGGDDERPAAKAAAEEMATIPMTDGRLKRTREV
jgi:hypothetical protein